MGGAVAAVCADELSVEVVVGLAPWLSKQLPLDALRGRRLAIVYGSLDQARPGIPGVSAARPWGAPVPLPGARRMAARIEGEIARFS